MYQFFAHFKMIQDHLRDKWTLNGTSEHFDTLIATVPDAIMMTQKALNVTPEDGFQVHSNRKKNSSTQGNSSSDNGTARRNSAPNILQQNTSRQPLPQAERIKNGV